MSAAIIGGATALLGTGFSIYKGLKQESQANQIQKNLKSPSYNIPSEFYENRNIARQMSQLGLPQQQYNNSLNQINANQAASIAAASRTANPGAAISNITGQSNNAVNNLNAEDASARLNNQRYYVQQNAELGGQNLAQQQANVFDPYTQHYNEMQAYRGAGDQNLSNAFGDITQLGGLAVQYGLMPNTTTGTPNTGTGIQDWGAGTMGAANNSPMLQAQGGFDSGVGLPNYNPYGSNYLNNLFNRKLPGT